MTSILKAAISGLAERLGYTVIPNWRLDGYQTNQHLRRLFDLLRVDLVIDVGANRGQYYRRLRQEVGYAGDVLSFEPVPELAEELKQQSAADPRWTVHGVALGAEAGALTFNVMKDTQFSSFRAPLRDGVLRFEGLNEVERTVQVEVRTLDQVLTPLLAERQRRVYLKLDTQGFDLEVLKGGTASLAGVLALQFEASFESIYDGMPRYADVIEYARARGFVLSGIYQNNPGHFPLMIEADCIMLRAAAVQSR